MTMSAGDKVRVFEVARAKHTLATIYHAYHAYGHRWNQREGGGGDSGDLSPSVLLEEARNLYEQVHISKQFIIYILYIS